MLDVKRLCFSYATEPVLRDVSITFETGINCVCGPNACGKTTLLKCIAGQLQAEGQVCYHGEDLASALKKKPSLIGYMAQYHVTNATLSVLEVVMLGCLDQIVWRVTPTLLEQVEMVLVELDIVHLAHCPINQLSGGQQQLVFIAQALVRNPDILLLDEPTNNLDVHHQFELFELIEKLADKRQLMVVCVLHDLNLAARFGARLVILNNGEVCAEGVPQDVLDDELIQDTFRVYAQRSVFQERLLIAPYAAVRSENGAVLL